MPLVADERGLGEGRQCSFVPLDTRAAWYILVALDLSSMAFRACQSSSLASAGTAILVHCGMKMFWS